MLEVGKEPPQATDRTDPLSATASEVFGDAISSSPIRPCASVDEAQQALAGSVQG